MSDGMTDYMARKRKEDRDKEHKYQSLAHYAISLVLNDPDGSTEDKVLRAIIDLENEARIRVL